MRRLAEISLARPRLVLALALALMVALLATAVLRLSFDGDLIRVLKSPSPAFSTFTELEARFHPFSRDETLLLEADDFGRPERFEALEELIGEFHFLPGVAAVYSFFALAEGGGPGLQAPAGWLDDLHGADPAVRMMLSADRGAVLVLLMPEDATGLPAGARAEALELIADLGGGAVTGTFVGLAATYRALEGALMAVQLALAPFATLLCLGMGAVLFRSWRGALVIAVPGLVAAGGFMGLLALLRLPLDIMTTLVPLLVLVLGVAQAMHLAFAIRQERDGGLDARAACTRALVEVGPACVLSTLTTMLAFASFAFAGFDALDRLALAGGVGLALQLVAVLVLTPVLALLLSDGAKGLPAPPRWLDAPARAGAMLLSRRALVVAAGLVALVVAGTGHLRIVPGHSLDEHLLQGGPEAQAEARIRDRLPGTGQIFVIVEAPGPGAALAPQIPADARARLLEALEVVAPDDPAHPRTVERLADALERAAARGGGQNPLLRRVVATDGSAWAVPLVEPLAPAAAEAAARASAREDRLVAAGLEGQVRLSGLSHLGAIEVPRMVEALRRGLLLTILLIVALVGVLSRSWRLALAALVPNAVPVLGIEAVLWMTGQPLTMTAAVALTIAFGIAVDDTLHLLNRWRIERTRAPHDAIARTLRAVSRPIVASTALILAGLAATLTSALPSVASFGMIVMISMTAALVMTLLVLPAFLPRDTDAAQTRQDATRKELSRAAR